MAMAGIIYNTYPYIRVNGDTLPHSPTAHHRTDHPHHRGRGRAYKEDVLST